MIFSVGRQSLLSLGSLPTLRSCAFASEKAGFTQRREGRKESVRKKLKQLGGRGFPFADLGYHLVKDLGEIEFAGVDDDGVVGDGERRIFA